MKIKTYVPAILLAVPLLGYAFVGNAQNSYFARVASAAYGGDKVTVCHKTGSDVNPYVKVTVPQHTADKFIERGGTYPDGNGDCPGGSKKDNIEARKQAHMDKQNENRNNS